MPVNTWGYVYTNCPECGIRNRVFVTFPAYNQPFRPTTHECRRCGVLLKVTDPHKYDIDGRIIEGGSVYKCVAVNITASEK